MWRANERRLEMINNDIKTMLYIMIAETLIALAVIIVLGLNGMLI